MAHPLIYVIFSSSKNCELGVRSILTIFICLSIFLGCPLRMVIEGRGLIKLCFVCVCVCVCVCYGVFLHISYHCITLWLQMVTRMSLFNLRPLLLFNPSHK